MKDVVFEKTSLDDLRAFPEEARRDAGRQLDRVQRGKEPFDSKPMTSIGSGVREIRITDAAGQFRVTQQLQQKWEPVLRPEMRLAIE